MVGNAIWRTLTSNDYTNLIGACSKEVDLLIGDPTKAKTKLGWECKYDLADLVKDMMQSDLKLMQKDQYLKEGGYTTLNYFE
jgi:GDPmannose 4,6-dehydratase